jgi:CRP-like cAMP-binding protein
MDSGGEDDESEPIRGSEEPAFDPQAPLGEWRREVGQGDIIGEITLLSSCKRTATVITAQVFISYPFPSPTRTLLCPALS